MLFLSKSYVSEGPATHLGDQVEAFLRPLSRSVSEHPFDYFYVDFGSISGSIWAPSGTYFSRPDPLGASLGPIWAPPYTLLPAPMRFSGPSTPDPCSLTPDH